MSVRYECKGRLAVITLDRPAALNALTTDMIGEVENLARRAEADPTVFAICITGEGRGFCAGLDMSALADHAAGKAPPTSAEALAHPERRMMFSALPTIAKPVIAAVNGVAAGGGFILAMMSDLRFMAEGASLITVFSRRGLVAEHGSAFMLTRQIGLSRALDLLWSSRRIEAAEALRIGLADRIVSGESLVAAVEAYVEEMAATVAPRSVAAMKRQAYAYLEMTFAEAATDTAALIDASLAHPDATEGAASFVERRPPRFAPLEPDAFARDR